MNIISQWFVHAAHAVSWANLLWSLVTCAVSCLGLWLSGRNVKHGWMYGIVSQAVWLVAGIYTGRIGDIILCFVFVGMYIRNLRRWRHVSGRPEQPAAPICPNCAAEIEDDKVEVLVP